MSDAEIAGVAAVAERVWKVELMPGAESESGIVYVLHARGGSLPEQMPLHDFTGIGASVR